MSTCWVITSKATNTCIMAVKLLRLKSKVRNGVYGMSVHQHVILYTIFVKRVVFGTQLRNRDITKKPNISKVSWRFLVNFVIKMPIC